MYGAHQQAQFLQSPVMQGQNDFWGQYHRNAQAASHDQIELDKSKSSIMNPQWQRYLQMTYSPAKQSNFKFNR